MSSNGEQGADLQRARAELARARETIAVYQRSIATAKRRHADDYSARSAILDLEELVLRHLVCLARGFEPTMWPNPTAAREALTDDDYAAWRVWWTVAQSYQPTDPR